MIDVLLDFAQKAGAEMEKRQKNLHLQKNKDKTVCSVVTEVDIYVSDLFAKTIEKHFSALNYIIIDEEKIEQYGKDIFKKIEESEYQFVVDPIDGTILYTNGLPLYGITIGVYKKGKPLIGLIYLPQTRELAYYDKKAYYVTEAFTENQVITEPKPQTHSQSPIIFGHAWKWRLKKGYNIEKALFLNFFSAVSQSIYTLVGKSKAYCMYMHLWDMAGVLPIAQYLGMKIFEYGTDRVYDCISPQYFDDELMMQKHCILCYPEDYTEICDMVEPV
jgi:myo-inositol-1(or 4)-monophosphatase